MRRYDENRPCPKCGFTKIDDIHGVALIHGDGKPVREEFIVRHCLRCKYHWDEYPLDAKRVTA